MSRRTFQQVAADAARAERGAVAAYARDRAEAIGRLIERQQLTAHEGSMLQRRLRGFADDIEAGLHA
jgi:hypothetical protein